MQATVKGEAIELGGESIPITPENAPRIRQPISALRSAGLHLALVEGPGIDGVVGAVDIAAVGGHWVCGVVGEAVGMVRGRGRGKECAAPWRLLARPALAR